MSDKCKTMSVFQQLQAGLEDSISHSKGRLRLKTTTLPSPPPMVRAKEVAALRRLLGMSQAIFAATLNVSPKTVQSWEQGIRRPADVALRMLQVIRERPQVVRMIMKPSALARRLPAWRRAQRTERAQRLAV